MLIADIPLRRLEGETDADQEWLTVRRNDGYVSIGVDYLSKALGGQRTSWQDMGVSFTFEHLDAVIAALVCVRDEVQRMANPTNAKRSTER